MSKTYAYLPYFTFRIRFADTQEQKSLKQQTQAARQFRSAEYEYATAFWRQNRLPASGTTAVGPDNNSTNELDTYLGTAASVPITGQRWHQSAIRQVSQVPARPYAGPAAPSPLVQINVAGATTDDQAGPSETVVDSKSVATSPATTHAGTPITSQD